MKTLLYIIITPFLVFSQTPCLDAVANATGAIGEYIPQCEDDGSYSLLQCWSSTGYCWCVDENGVEIPGSSMGPGEGVPNCYDSIFCSQLNVTDVVIDTLNMMIDIAIFDGNNGAPYPYVAYTIDNMGDTIQTGNLNSFGNLGQDTSWYMYPLNSLPTYPLNIYYVYGMNSDTCVLSYDLPVTTINENFIKKKLLKIINISGQENQNRRGLKLLIYDDGTVKKKYKL